MAESTVALRLAGGWGRVVLPLTLTLALAACQTMPTREPGTDTAPAQTPAPALASTNEVMGPPRPARRPRPTLPGVVETSPPAPEPEPELDLWQQMREGFALPGCDYAPGTERWARRYAASPRRFAAVLEDLLPALDYTHRQVRDAQLPSEFALLPIVESHFKPYPGNQSQPAGIWQIVGGTGRVAGLRMDSWVDERLNFAASTDAALHLLDRYGDYFQNDWRLAVFAYNAGEYRVRKAIERHQPGDSFASLRGLGLAEGSYDYLTKLLALACLVREPERFDLELPSLEPERRLERIELDGVIGSTLARALSGLSSEEFARYNAGLRRDRTPPGDSFPLLVRSPHAERAQQVLAELPASARIGWHQRALDASESLADIAAEHGLAPTTLLALNGVADPAAATPRQRFWLPGQRGAGSSTPGDPDLDRVPASGVHVVRSGDSLWAIARRHGLTVQDLLRYNGMNDSRIRPGQRLRLQAP